MLKKALQTHWIDRWRTKRRVRFIEGIGNLRDGTAPAVPALTEALHDSDAGVRKMAAEALEKIGTLEARAALEAWRQSQQKGRDDGDTT